MVITVNSVEMNSSYVTRDLFRILVTLICIFLVAMVASVALLWNAFATIVADTINRQSIYIPLIEP